MRYSGRSRRALAILLTGVLSFEVAFASGLATALADQLSVDQSDRALEAVAQEGDGVELSDGDERTEPWDWTGDMTHLLLSSKGISIDYESAKDLVDGEQEGEETDYQLPDHLPATLAVDHPQLHRHLPVAHAVGEPAEDLADPRPQLRPGRALWVREGVVVGGPGEPGGAQQVGEAVALP